uniref:Uncharacterized protein n=1 Tax=Setaria viridis TaxID=4556 RepID=A0A4U6UGX3_SETVI|nr:hypothetical protein SEVIR_5G233650v2 [Setaria viridis]
MQTEYWTLLYIDSVLFLSLASCSLQRCMSMDMATCYFTYANE